MELLLPVGSKVYLCVLCRFFELIRAHAGMLLPSYTLFSPCVQRLGDPYRFSEVNSSACALERVFAVRMCRTPSA